MTRDRWPRCIRLAVVGTTAVLLSVGCSVFDDEPQRDSETGELVGPRDLSVFELQVGDCLGGYADGVELSDVNAVPCSEEHDDEVFASVSLPEEEFPGSAEIQEQATTECSGRFADFVGVEAEESELAFGYLSPTEQSWEQGDRVILCTVSDPEGPTTGTLKNSDR